MARLLWALPVWWALVALAGIAGFFAVEKWRSRARVKAYQGEVDAKIHEWEPCSARKKIFDGLELHCVKRAGHDGDDADHLADRSEAYWPGS